MISYLIPDNVNPWRPVRTTNSVDVFGPANPFSPAPHEHEPPVIPPDEPAPSHNIVPLHDKENSK